MQYISTRGNFQAVSSAEAIRLGMVPTGGLFVPAEIPEFTPENIEGMQDKSYQEIALEVLEKYLTDFSREELKKAIFSAYNKENFPGEDVTPLIKLNNDKYFLELWHGPTAAFKDLALQLMPYLLKEAANKSNVDKEIIILVATSGDTGKAALEGFKNIPGVIITVFFPEDGVSTVQKRQMLSTGGDNTAVVAVRGNFDDCQNAVKNIFADKDFNKIINTKGYQFSSANSINWGRLVPQIVYYFVAYVNLRKKGKIENGQKINITVPTGNFGNILAGFYACKMGLPVNKFICASNENKILTDFLRSGIYDVKREFKKTISPSMDILISSNLERFLFINTDNNPELINKWYNDLKNKGKFIINKNTRSKIRQIFRGEYASEKETQLTIKEIYKKYKYLVDPHTAVGIRAYEKFEEKENTDEPVIIASTASPYKFSKAVLESLKGNISTHNEFEILQELRNYTDEDIHRALKNIEESKIRHNRISDKDKLRKEIIDIII